MASLTLNDLRYQYYATALGLTMTQAVKQSLADLEFQALLTGALSGGGGGSPLPINDEGTQIVAATNKLNFVGPEVAATSDGAGGANVTTSILPYTPVKTANYTANPNEYVLVDTTSGNITITLPLAPQNGTKVGIRMVIQGGTNTVTAVSQGSDNIGRPGLVNPNNPAAIMANTGIVYEYFAASSVWIIHATAVTVNILDTRYLIAATTPTVAAGADLTLSAVVSNVQTMDVSPAMHSLWTPVFARSLSDQTVTGSVTMVNDTELICNVAANVVYDVEAKIVYNSPATADFKFGWGTTATGATMDWGVVNGVDPSYPGSGTGAFSLGPYALIITSVTATQPGQGASNSILFAKGLLTTLGVAGTLTFKFAQGTSDAGNTIRRAGSSVILRRVL